MFVLVACITSFISYTDFNILLSILRAVRHRLRWTCCDLCAEVVGSSVHQRFKAPHTDKVQQLLRFVPKSPGPQRGCSADARGARSWAASVALQLPAERPRPVEHWGRLRIYLRSARWVQTQVIADLCEGSGVVCASKVKKTLMIQPSSSSWTIFLSYTFICSDEQCRLLLLLKLHPII